MDDSNQTGVDNPQLGPLQDNGGSTFTHLPEIGSPAIDTGITTAGQATDQIGSSRPQGNGFDIGAVERLVEPGDLLVTIATGTVDRFNFQTSLREAITFASNQVGQDTILFASGLANQTLTLNNSLILADFSGTISLEGAGVITIDGGGNGRVFEVVNDTIATFDGLTITGGSADTGAGIFNEASLSLINTTITGNSANLDGGGVANFGLGTLSLTNTTVTGNSAGGFGGGIINLGGPLTITNAMINGNSAGSNGGGVANFGDTLNLNGSTVQSNFAAGYGGGIANDSGSVNVAQTTVSGNSATQGGGFFNYVGIMSLSQTTVSGNSATQDGGGIRNAYGTLSLINATVSGNSAETSGGGIENDRASAMLTHVTVFTNTASSLGGGLNAYDDYDTSTTLSNSIVSGNSANGSANNLSGKVPETTSQGNLIGNSTASLTDLDNTNQTGIDDPKLGPLQNNGGPTFTHLPNSDSPALNAGADARAIDDQNNPLTTDQPGAPIVRFNGQVDVGAVEAQTLRLVVDITNDENDGNFTQGDLSLREAVLLANTTPGSNTITFASSLTSQTLTLGSQLILSDTLGTTTIQGLGADVLIIDAQATIV